MHLEKSALLKKAGLAHYNYHLSKGGFADSMQAFFSYKLLSGSLYLFSLLAQGQFKNLTEFCLCM